MKRKRRDDIDITPTANREAGIGLELLILGIADGVLASFQRKGNNLSFEERVGVKKVRKTIQGHLKETRKEIHRQ